MLEEALADLGYGPEAGMVRYTWVEDDATAVEQSFVGSPTFRVNGADLFSIAPGEVYGLTCRLYTRRNGRPSPLPDPDDLRDALRVALGQQDLARVRRRAPFAGLPPEDLYPGGALAGNRVKAHGGGTGVLAFGALGHNWTQSPRYFRRRARFCPRRGRWVRFLTSFRYITGPNASRGS